MEQFKAGDLVKSTKYKHLKPIKIKSIYESNTRPGTFGLKSDGSVLYSDEVKLWIPEPGEWCWFWDNETDVPTLAKLISISKLFDRKETYIVATPSCISESSYNYSRTISFNNCEPFIGEFPYNLKE